MAGRAAGRIVVGALFPCHLHAAGIGCKIAFQNNAAVSAILFKATAETLTTIAADPRHLRAKIGFIGVLHTWGQNLQHHPHVHCLVPGGGLSLDGTRWVCCRPGFFLPVRVLSRLFRRLFLEKLWAAFKAGKLGLFGALAGLADPAVFARRRAELRRLEWVVYAKRPFAGPEVVSYVQQMNVYPLGDAATLKSTRFVDGFPKPFHSLPVCDPSWFSEQVATVSVNMTGS